MSSRRNFLDADNNIMERNLRFVQNDLEDNLNQYFGGSGSRGNSTAISAPPRDYKVVQPKPAGKPAEDLEERRKFLLEMGLARHESYDLAKVANFDVNYYQAKRYEWLKNGAEESQVDTQIIFEIKSGDYKVGGSRDEFRSSFNRRDNITPQEIYNDYSESNPEASVALKMSSFPREEDYLQTDEFDMPPPPPRLVNWNYEKKSSEFLSTEKPTSSSFDHFADFPSTSHSKSQDISRHPIKSPQVVGRSLHNDTGSRLEHTNISSAKTASGNHIRPSKARHNQKRLCLKIVDNLSSLDFATLSDKQKLSLSWAKGVLLELEEWSKKRATESQCTANLSYQKAEKRQLTSDGNSLAKRPNTMAMPMSDSFIEVVKGNIVMAIINREHEDGKIFKGQWTLIENKLAGIYKQVLEEMPGSPPLCDDAGWYQGRVKLISFKDKRSLALYKAAISKVSEMFPGIKLDIVSQHDIPSRPRALAWIPAFPSDADAVLDILQSCNPNLPTANWKIPRIGELDGDRRQAVILLNAESLPHLTRTKGKVRYGFGNVTLKVYKND